MTVPGVGNTLSGDAMRRVSAARLLLWLGECTALLLGVAWVGMRFHTGPVLALLAIHAALIAVHWLGEGRAARADKSDTDTGASGRAMFLHLLADALVVAALVYFTGGIANPLISLLLVPLILTATLFPAAYAWLMTAAVAGLYTLLMFQYHPMQVDVSDGDAVNFHLWGMWLSFLFSALLVALFVVRLTGSLRRHEQRLAMAREAALRDERLFALGMQAAAAAHDLSTPLATFNLTLQEMRDEYAGDEELAPYIRVMDDQVARMRSVLGALRAVAGAGPLDSGQPCPAVAWLRRVTEQWQLMRPKAVLQVRIPTAPDSPVIRDEPMLTAALLSLLNNAAEASASHGVIELEAVWQGGVLCIRVLDRGTGGGRIRFGDSSKPEGWGVGLQLAEAGLSRLGGQLRLTPRPGGGMAAEIAIPLHALQKEAEHAGG